MNKGEIYKVLYGSLRGAFLKVEEIRPDDRGRAKLDRICGKICFPEGVIGEENLSRHLLSETPLTKEETIHAFRSASDQAFAKLFKFFSEPKHGV